jgi:hypothetical protein
MFIVWLGKSVTQLLTDKKIPLPIGVRIDVIGIPTVRMSDWDVGLDANCITTRVGLTSVR